MSRLRKNRIKQLQTRDPVTGLLNRQGFFQLLDQWIMVEDTCALVLVELSNLQRRYPQLSPQLMDKFVAMIASQSGKLAASSGLSARIGDYTFAYLVSGKTADEIRKLGQLLSHSLSARIFDVEQHSLMVSCSVGIAISHKRPDDGLTLFNMALNACEEAQSAGNNRVSVRTVDSALVGNVARDENELLVLLQDAPGYDRFRLVYQPIVSLRGNAVEKYEVLLRLHDKHDVVVPPAQFFPVAERHGLMESIDRWVVEHTIQTLQKIDNGSHFFVKVSTGTLHDSEFMSFLKDCLARYGVDGGRLVFEFDASSLRDGARYVSGFAAQLSRLNCNISIEHLDIKQDTTQLLEHVPASYVKLDGASLQGLADDPVNQERLRIVVSQAEQKGARTIAGFVEDIGCLQLLWQSGVHYIQGNFLQEPDESLGFEFGVEGTV
jgi:diguanylate cyclase (GGDEF)-like protein